MQILMSPQVRDKNKIWYDIEGQKISVTINGVSDTFDFTDMPNGDLQLYDEEGNYLVESVLEDIPILSARKDNGELKVELLFSIEPTETDERLLFPTPMTLEEFKELMADLVSRKEEKNKSSEPTPITKPEQKEPEPVAPEPQEDEHVEFTEVGGMEDILDYIDRTGTTSIQLERQMEELEKEGYIGVPDVENKAEGWDDF